MSTSTPPRIWTSTLTPKKGEMVRVRAQISHRMETGLRLDEHGQIKPRDIVTRFEAHPSLLAGLSKIPAYIDQDYSLIDQAVENIQRDNLTPKKIADVIGRLLAEGISSPPRSRATPSCSSSMSPSPA